MTVDSDSLLGSGGKIFPPGFRFHPTDEELVLYYLKKKICCKRHRMDVIADVDVYKWDPEDLPEMSKLKTGDRQWFFFSPRDRKYPNGARSNRGTACGYWKATGKDRVITSGSRDVGLKKTLVFYRGRAPSGLRTDWVMHEYTMDEEELKRCKNINDYYALYKLYKKSGPGPKNGEQYGAPFREEDWADDDDDVDVRCLQENPASVECNNVTSIDDLERILNSLDDDEDEPIAGGDACFALEEFAFSGNDYPFPVPLEARFDPSRPTDANQLQLLEPVVDAKDLLLEAGEEDFLKDYLEMEDLIATGPPNAEETEKPVVDDFGTNFFDEIDGLSEFDLYQETTCFFPEPCPIETGQILTQNCDPTLFLHNYEIGNGANQLLLPLPENSNLIDGQMWEDHGSLLTSADASAPGTILDHQNRDFVTGGDENGGRKRDEGEDSWLSSALWSFVESIPTTPASASELALVNKAFVRVSSFSRVRLSERSSIAAAGSRSSSGKFRRNFMCFSVVGLICAVLWVVIR